MMSHVHSVLLSFVAAYASYRIASHHIYPLPLPTRAFNVLVNAIDGAFCSTTSDPGVHRPCHSGPAASCFAPPGLRSIDTTPFYRYCCAPVRPTSQPCAAASPPWLRARYSINRRWRRRHCSVHDRDPHGGVLECAHHTTSKPACATTAVHARACPCRGARWGQW